MIGIAACTETFFRDLHFFLLRCKPGMLQRALNEPNRKEPASRLTQYIARGVSPEEFAAHQASFQNAEAINQNISIFFPSLFFANTKTQISTDEMRRIETTALLICQMTALLPGIEPRVIVSERNLPTILLIEDLISEDWEIAEDEPAAS